MTHGCVNLYSEAWVFHGAIVRGAIVRTGECRMLDLFGIMFSSVMMLIVIIRAVQLDRTKPWFQAVKRKEAPTPAGKRAWQRRTSL